jgi:hypothetical protein
VTRTATRKKDKPPTEKKDDGEKVIEGKFTEKPGEARDEQRAVAVRDRVEQPQELAQWTPSFAKEQVDRAITMVTEKKRFFSEVMTSGEHYGIIPGQHPTKRINQGTGEEVKDAAGNVIYDAPKPALLKPGAELLNAAMGLHPILPDRLRNPEFRTIEEQRDGEWYLEAQSYCEIRRQTGPGPDDYMVIAGAGGSANSWEVKYRYRGQKGRVCPECGKEGTVRKGSEQYAPRENGRTGPILKGYEKGGFYCWRKQDGCGATFPDADTRITDQKIEREKNDDPHDLKNTLEKMADKRALVAATLIATGCSDLFTQDIEETNGEAAPSAAAAASTKDGAAAAPPKPAPKATMDGPTRTLIENTVKALFTFTKAHPDDQPKKLMHAAWVKFAEQIGLNSFDDLKAEHAEAALRILELKPVGYQRHETVPTSVVGKPETAADAAMVEAVAPGFPGSATELKKEMEKAAVDPMPEPWRNLIRQFYRQVFELSKSTNQGNDFAKKFVRETWKNFMDTEVFKATGSDGWEALWSRKDLAAPAAKLLGIELPPLETPASAPVQEKPTGFDPDSVPE